MRALAPVLFLFVALAVKAQDASPISPTPAQVPCSEQVMSARCECGKGMSGAFANANFPRIAARAGLDQGTVVVSFLISSTGEASDIQIKESTHESFSDEVTRLVKKIRCKPEAEGLRVTMPFRFKMQ